MFKRSVTTAIVVLSVPSLGGVAIALANSIDTTPAPVSVTHSTLDDKGGLTGRGGTDDPANHDINDDKGGLTGGGTGSSGSGSGSSGSGHGSDD